MEIRFRSIDNVLERNDVHGLSSCDSDASIPWSGVMEAGSQLQAILSDYWGMGLVHVVKAVTAEENMRR